jgi:hypothetical protein
MKFITPGLALLSVTVSLASFSSANDSHLLASHCKPWRDSSNEERLNGENGFS